MPRRSSLSAVAVAVALAGALLAGCSDGDDDAPAAATTTSTTTAPSVTVSTSPAFVPIPGGEDDDGDPLPPPVHAVFSVVVRGDTSWAPYASRELTGLDVEATAAIGDRLRQIDDLLAEAGIPASIELAYGPAAALCAEDPDLLERLESHGHVIGMHARTNGETFRALRALDACGRTPTTASGVASMADPVGPEPTTVDSFFDALAVLDVHGTSQIVGALSPTCESLGLGGHTNEYGTGAFTAPWRSAWFDGNPCADSPAGEIVAVDQVPLQPGDGDERVDADAVARVDSRLTQTLGWAASFRFEEPEALPVPGMLTWGVTVRLDDLLAPTAGPDDESTDDESAGDETGDDETADDETDGAEVEDVDPRVAPLSEEVLTSLRELLAERQADVDAGRIRWMTPDEVGLLLRPR